MPTIHHGDCIETMNAMPPESIDAIVTDPPYGLGFMGKKWDGLPPSLEWAEACYRVLKPGGHIAAFGGTRTWHRLAVAIEDAGFEMRDSLAWLYGSGFPKSHDVGKAIDKAAPRADMFAEFAAHYGARRKAAGLNHRQVCEAGRFYGEHNKGGASVNWEKGYGVPTPAQWDTLAPLLGLSSEWLPLIERVEAEREVIAERKVADRRGDGTVVGLGHTGSADITAPATPEAAQWDGWGTALKPAFEPIVLARKPLAEKTVARNVLAHGTGAINVDACRIGHGEPQKTTTRTAPRYSGAVLNGGQRGGAPDSAAGPSPSGRWPANVLLDQHAAAWVDEQSGEASYNPAKTFGRSSGGSVYGNGAGIPSGADVFGYGDRGGASRFFYTAKAPKSERPNVDGVQHPTVKPLAIMRWLIRLVTPPGGVVLDPFAGSGTTIEAALIEGFDPVGIEMEADYMPLIQHRIDRQENTLAVHN